MDAMLIIHASGWVDSIRIRTPEEHLLFARYCNQIAAQMLERYEALHVAENYSDSATPAVGDGATPAVGDGATPAVGDQSVTGMPGAEPAPVPQNGAIHECSKP